MLCGALTGFAQGRAEDFRRALDAPSRFSDSKIVNGNVQPRWSSDGKYFWYARTDGAATRYVAVDPAGKKRRALFDHAKFAAALTAKGWRTNADSIRLNEMSVDGDTVRFNRDGHAWAYAMRKGRLFDKGALPAPRKEPHWMVVDEEKDAAPVLSPDGKFKAYIKNGNVYVSHADGSNEHQLSIDGTDGNYYSSWIKWSPDSRKVATVKIRPAQKRFVHYVESSPRDQRQPRLHTQEYAKPGDELRFKVPCIFDVESGKAVIPSTELFDQQYEITGPEWNADASGIVFEYNQRGHKVYRMLELLTTGKVRTLVEEKSDKYVNYPRLYRHLLADGKRFLWTSERDNWNHLYIIDRESGEARQITRGEWYVRDVFHVDEVNEKIYFSANGVAPNEDPYNKRIYSVRFDGSEFTDLTPAPGMHRAWFSPDYRWLVDVASTPTTPPVAVLRSVANPTDTMLLERADITALEAQGWRTPEVFAAPGRDGKTMMWGLIQRPSNFDPSKKYPVVEYIYQGPGDQYVPKTFRGCNYWMTPLSELGFIVVMVDGMSTSFRSRDFENVCYKNLKDAALPDHLAWLRAAAEKYPEFDLDRVGIYGCSAGGQESLSAILQYPDFYKACYSACGCHDNRMDKIWWNELWMGYPVDEAYEECSNVAKAHTLSRPLMLVVGEMDDNVDPASTMQVADALIRAGKDFELVVIPGARHTMGERYGDRKRYDFFVKHLMGIDPPKWNEY